MSRLIQLRQRIKAIQTIKKVTHAMRLISMSSHTKLKGKEEDLKAYRTRLLDLFKTVKENRAHNTPEIEQKNNAQQKLVILISSQKGLCGNFNTGLFSFFEKNITAEETSYIAIGKKAADFIQKEESRRNSLIKTFDTLTVSNHLSLAEQLTDMIMQKADNYESVTVVSNKLKSFFIQKPYTTTLLPLQEDDVLKDSHQEAPLKESYLWEQKPEEIATFLSQLYFEVSLQYLLFQSLLSEQAARFLSMDNATRNADNLLETATLDYNKLRQAKITKELTELAGSFQPK